MLVGRESGAPPPPGSTPFNMNRDMSEPAPRPPPSAAAQGVGGVTQQWGGIGEVTQQRGGFVGVMQQGGVLKGSQKHGGWVGGDAAAQRASGG